MRNLSLWKSSRSDLDATRRSRHICAVSIDPEQDALYVATEFRNADADTEIEIWRVAGGEPGPEEHKINPPNTIRVASYTTCASPSFNSTKPISKRVPEIISMKLLPDTRDIVLVTRTGDIATLPMEEEEAQVEVIGSVESGILAAAWGPDDTLLVLVTGDDKLILMTSTFDILLESPLHPSDFGEDAPIALGWGAKHTQFHGSLGKGAAQAGLDLSTVGMSPDDDGCPRVSWRGDGAFFVVSALLSSTVEGTRQHRILRVYSRDGALQSTTEPVAGLEHTLAWRPSGNLIVGTQRFGADEGLGKGREGRHDVIFFERNGLRHGEFGLREWTEGKKVKEKAEEGDVSRWGYAVREIGWSADSNVLSVWIEGNDGDIVQLWTTGNYHWYLKQEIPAPRNSLKRPGRFTSVSWHPEDALRIILTTDSEIIQRTYAWGIYSSPSKPPVDSGSVAVFDGTRILLTPFRTQNVPPPMSSYVLPVSAPSLAQSSMDALKTSRTSVPVHAAFSTSRDILALLWEPGFIELVDLHTRLGPGHGKVMNPERIWVGRIDSDDERTDTRCYRQIIVWNLAVTGARSEIGDVAEVIRLAVLSTDPSEAKNDMISIVSVRANRVQERYEVQMPSRNGRIVPADEGITWQAADGELFTIDTTNRSLVADAQFTEFCFSALHHLGSRAAGSEQSLADLSPSLFIGLSHGGKLHVASSNGESRTLATNVNSFTVASGFLIFTTTAHVAQFASLHILSSILSGLADATLLEWETRRVERGSRIVAAVPSTMSLVLQMPRGNLETINPRPLVMEIVRQDIDREDYGKAFLSCRKHRIDLNVFVEHNRVSFMERLPSFVHQVGDPDYINLFLTSIGQGSLPAEVVSEVCDGVRLELEKNDLKRYVNSILTAHVVKRPPDHEAGLALLLRLRDTEPQLVEDAVKYIIFLVDADKLFDTALGMYDFSLVLMIAQHAQKDPREYLPFLRELRALDHYYQRFKIDDHLKRHEKALVNLSLAGPERFDEAIEYVEKHQLYDHALSIWRKTDHYEAVLNAYGDWLFERRNFREAAFVFRQARKPLKAMVAHEKALDWQELFELALQVNVSGEDLESMAYRVAEDLSSKKRFMDAVRVLLDYAHNVEEATRVLVEGNHFSEARRVITLGSRLDLLADIIHPGALDSRAQIAEEISEMRDQLRKQVQRLRELRVRKVEEPDAFYGVEDMDLHNVDVMTDISMARTAFTRYTQAPSTVSRTTSKRSSRSKRKLERKVGSGRKGTVGEEEYLLKSVTKLVGRFTTARADAVGLLPHLLQFTEEHQKEGRALQQELLSFGEELGAAVEEIWKRPPESDGAIESAPADSWAARMQEYAKQRQTDPLEKVVKPELTKMEWTLRLPDAQL
ncbi:hypothetical protein AcV5_002129 [Taiwanofungus camphoratus]|nr:hypothetical protein AcV5_002129 [Antrodia cinnamomea]